MIRARVDPDLNSEVEGILSQLGLATAEAIHLFYHQVKLNKGLPSAVRIPNKTEYEVILERTGRHADLFELGSFHLKRR
jgi:DNA-damage-inducible protein J